MNYGYHINNLNALARKLQKVTSGSEFSRFNAYQICVDIQMEAQAVKDLIHKEDNDRNNTVPTVPAQLVDNVYMVWGEK
jgi:hypothetical protein